MTRSFVFHKVILILCSLSVLASCGSTPRIAKNYAGPDRGILVLSIAASDAAPATSYEITFSDAEHSAANEFTYIKTDLNLAHKRDFNDGIVAMASLPPGDYLFNTLSAYTSSAGFGGEGTTLDLDIPFSIKPNEVTYVGRLRAIESDSSFGYEVTDASSVDLPSVYEKEASIGTLKVRVQLHGISEYRDVAFTPSSPSAATPSVPSTVSAGSTDTDMATPDEITKDAPQAIDTPPTPSEATTDTATDVTTTAPAVVVEPTPQATAPSSTEPAQAPANTETAPVSTSPALTAPMPAPDSETAQATSTESTPESTTDSKEETPAVPPIAKSSPSSAKADEDNADEDKFEIKKGVRKSKGKYGDDVSNEIEKLKQQQREETDSSRDFQFF